MEEVVEDILDRRGVTPLKLGGEFVSSGHRVISAKLIKDGRVALGVDEPRYVDSVIYKKWMKSPLRQGDVIMTSEAPLGELAYLDQPQDWVLGQRLFAIRPRKDILSGKFLYYVLATQSVRDSIVARASGTTVQGIRQAELRKVEIPVPPLNVQIEAAAVLGALDGRIDVLRQTNATLEAIAQTLFKSWFVDFDPVHAKADGREPEGMDAATAALFPGKFEASELGLIPKGWQAGCIGDLLTLQRGFDLPAPQRIDGEFLILAASGPSGHHQEAKVSGPGVTTGRSGVLGKVFYVTGDFWPLNTSLWIKDFKIATAPYAYQFLRSMDLAHLNAGSAVPTLNRNHVHGVSCVVPEKSVIDAYTSVAVPLLKRAHQTEKYALRLSELRDTLLPRLISGKLRLPEATADVDELLHENPKPTFNSP
ncbi:MAG: restriction endonuclease subunit S [Pseudoxanthomonas sp.]